jgi:hypothetical protein
MPSSLPNLHGACQDWIDYMEHSLHGHGTGYHTFSQRESLCLQPHAASFPSTSHSDLRTLCCLTSEIPPGGPTCQVALPSLPAAGSEPVSRKQELPLRMVCHGHRGHLSQQQRGAHTVTVCTTDPWMHSAEHAIRPCPHHDISHHRWNTNISVQRSACLLVSLPSQIQQCPGQQEHHCSSL